MKQLGSGLPKSSIRVLNTVAVKGVLAFGVGNKYRSVHCC